MAWNMHYSNLVDRLEQANIRNGKAEMLSIFVEYFESHPHEMTSGLKALILKERDVILESIPTDFKNPSAT